MPQSLWELIFRSLQPFKHITEVRLRDARTAQRTAEAKLRALDMFTQRVNGAMRRDDE